MASRHDDRLSDFTTNSRLLILAAMAVVIGVMSSLVAYALVWLIGVATNLVWYHRYSSVLTSPAKSALGSDSGRPAPVSPLTAQEKRILRLFAQGTASAAVARTLGISPHTLRNHLHHINRKLRTHSRLEAVTHAIKRNLI